MAGQKNEDIGKRPDERMDQMGFRIWVEMEWGCKREIRNFKRLKTPVHHRIGVAGITKEEHCGSL